MPTARRTRKRTARAEEAAEQAAAAAPEAAATSETMSEKKAKKTKKEPSPKSSEPTKEEEAAAILAAILPNSISDDPSSLLCHLLVEIQSLANHKKRCTDALRALKDGRGVATPHFEEEEDEDEGGNEEREDEAAASSTGRGKKRTRSADKKKKGENGALTFDANDGNDVYSDENAQGIQDAHLIMAATQAINILIAYLTSCKEEGSNNEETVKHVALMAAALSHHLMTSLVNDKSLLESITKSSQYTSSHSSMPSSFGAAASLSSTWGSIREDDAEMEGGEAAGSSRGRKTKDAESEAMQQKLERKRKLTVSYAKAVAGRAMTSCVVGALNAMEALGELTFENQEGKKEEEEDETLELEDNLLRRGVWTCLLALETAFQLNNRPKLLMTSSMAASSLSISSGMAYSSGMDFDGMMTAVMGSLAGGSGANSTAWHTHTMMGSNTITMWNGLLQRIMFDYKLGFHLQNDGSSENVEEENQLLAQIGCKVTQCVFSDEDDSSFISIVLQQSATSISSHEKPPAKKTKRTPKTKKEAKGELANQYLADMSSLLAQRQENHVLFDCHVSVRRWSALAFGWLCSGQPRFLETCMNMLTRQDKWKKILELAPIQSDMVIAEEAKPLPSKKKMKDSKSKPSSMDATLPSPSERFRGIRGDLALVVFTSCMVDLISSGGISPSNSGWIGDYVKVITNMPEEEAPFGQTDVASSKKVDANDEHTVRRSGRAKSKAGAGKSNEKTAVAETARTSPKGGDRSWVRPNITDEVAYLTKLLMEAHDECLHDTFRDHLLDSESAFASPDARKLIVNDDDSYRDSSYRRHESKELVNRIDFYPFMHRTLETLGRTAAANSFVSSSAEKPRIQAIGGAIALRHFVKHYEQLENEESVAVLDAKLISLAVTQLSEAFDDLIKTNNSCKSNADALCNETARAGFLKTYRLNESLRIARIQKDRSDLDPRAVDASISYGGAFERDESKDPIEYAEVISCFVRALIEESSTNDAHQSGMESFLKSLLSIISMCYEFPSERPAVTTLDAMTTKKKKRKVTETSLTATSLYQSGSKTMTRCVLAADTLNFLRSCVTIRDSSSLSTEANCMVLYLRENEVFTTSMVKEFINTGYDLQDKLIQPRIAALGERASFTSEERRLWSSHVKLALVIGQGKTSFLQNEELSTLSLLEDNVRRLEVFKYISEVEKGRDNIRIPASEHFWPLAISSLQHALVASTVVACEPTEGSIDSPEAFLCKAFLASLARYDACNIDDQIPISLRDVRLFALAASKLAKEEQKSIFLKLIDVLQQKMQASATSIQNILLLSRGVCLASHMADIVTTLGLGVLLSREVASTHYTMPKFMNISHLDQEPRKDTAFMGLFDDSNTPTVPSNGVSLSSMLNDSELEKMSQLIRSGLQLGFEVSPLDGGYLLFSSWNASAKLCSWTSVCWNGPSTAATIKKQDIADRLIGLRDEMAEIYYLFHKNEHQAEQLSLLKRTTQSKNGRCRPNEALISGVTSIEQVMKKLSSDLEAETADSPSLPMFAYAEALTCHVAFLVALHTKPGSNHFSSIHRFSKSHVKQNKPVSYTDRDEFPSSDSDSESFESGGNSLKTRALVRLHNACVSLGAAPCWPDWLDTSCRMQTSVAPSVAVDSADSAILSLTNLGVVVFKRYCKAVEGALGIANRCTTGKPPISTHLLQRLLASQQLSLSEHLYSHLSLLSKTDVLILKALVNNRESLPDNKFATNSAQRVKGADATITRDPTLSEMRANEQWEMILAEVIRGSSLTNASLSSEKPDLRKALEQVSHWKRVLYNVVSSLVPSAALLRFGLYDARGRAPHPLCNDLPESALSSETIMSSRYSTRNEVGTNIKKALTFLSHICASSAQDDTLTRTSQVAATHLIESSAQSHFNSMISLQTVQLRLGVIQGLYEEVINRGSSTKAVVGATFALISRVLSQVSNIQCTSAVLASFGLKGALQTQLVGDRSVVECTDLCNPTGAPTPDVLRTLLLMLIGKDDQCLKSLRMMIAETLSRLVEREELLLQEKRSGLLGPFRLAATVSLDEMSKDEILQLVSIINPATGSFDLDIAKCTIQLLGNLITAKHESLSGDGCKVLLDEMTECINQWASFPQQPELTNLVCALASRFGTLPRLIEHLLSVNDLNLTECIRGVFQYIVALQDAGSTSPSTSANTSVELTRGDRRLSKNNQRRTCTFTQTGEGFAEQHWYNCYTCGLLWDKGCCSLCARVCHKDHDVGYSRKSSFFCDCGAEVASGGRHKCKCLEPVDDVTLSAINEDEPNLPDETSKQQVSSNPAQKLFQSYPVECSKTLQLLTKEAKSSSWNQTILDLFSKSFKKDNTFDFSALCRDSPANPSSNVEKPALDLRCGVPLNLQLLDSTNSIVPVRAAKASTVKIGMASSSPALHMRKHRSGRHLMESDMRGRLVCAEANALSFFGAIPSINTRYLETQSYSSHLSRSQLCLLGTERIKFEVHGLGLSENQKLLVVWGASDACVVIMSRGFDTIERTISLTLSLDSDSGECESECLLRCMWLTETIVVCVCGTVVHVFDLATTSTDDSCKATAHFALAYEDVLIRSAVLTSNLSPAYSKEVFKKLVLLLDSGRLHFIELFVNSDGSLEEEGETYIEIGSGRTFPSAGIRRYYGGEPSSSGSTTSTLGEGTNLHFLQQSNLLLYQCVSSPVVAMLLDDNGSIRGSFELLPSTISSDNLPGSTLGVVTGPYLHFQELSTAQRDGEVFYRVTCVARVPSTNQHRILLVEFNQSSSVSVKELLWPPSFSAGLGSFSSNSFVGSCTFSAPFLTGDSSLPGSIESCTKVYERAFLAMLSSNGSILWFGESQADVLEQKAVEPKASSKYMFEDPSIINVSDDDCLVFGGDCVGKDAKTAKKKLSLNNSEFISSPNREGCTLTARLDSNATNARDLAIVAVRVLVGSMPDSIPREISIMGSGRSIKTKRNMKRWYDFVLTDEEILLAVRNGFVTINLSSSHDLTSGAVVDAVEIYAKARSELRILKPADSKHTITDYDWKEQKHTTEIDQHDCISYIESLTALGKISGVGKATILGNNGRDVIAQILEKTALDSHKDGLRSSALSLLQQVEEDELEMSRFVSWSTLRGLMSSLSDLESFIKSDSMAAGETGKQEAMLARALDVLVDIVISSLNIARANIENYKSAMSSLIKETSKFSLAVEAKRITDYAAQLEYVSNVSFAHATIYVSELVLLEMACDGSDNFAQFDTLSQYLTSDDSLVVESCCKAILNCIQVPKSKQSASEKSTQDDNVNGVVTYQCDACKRFPIKDIRYTIGGEVDIDLCRECFDLGCSYANSNAPDSPLVIHGRTLCVEDEDMSCDSIWQMRGIVIAPPLTGFPAVADVEAVLKMNQTSKELASSSGGVDKESFRAGLFSNLLSLVSNSLSKPSGPSRHVINLLLEMVYGSKTEKSKIARGKEMLKNMTDCLRDLLQEHDTPSDKLVLLLRALSSLVTKKTSIDKSMALVAPKEQDKHKSKTDPRFVCDVHKVAAVRRRCSHGVDKDRRFYVCGLERKHRCNYFKWADDNPKQKDAKDVLEISANTFAPLRTELGQMLDASEQTTSSIQSQLCVLVAKHFEELKDLHVEVETKDVADKPKFLLRSEGEMKSDNSDGIIQSWIKLGKADHPLVSKCSNVPSESASGTAVVSDALYLFSLVASSQSRLGSDWHPVLCAIINGGSPALRHLAKKCLQQLCGGSQDMYHRIRDHYVYGYQFRKLLRQSEGLLDNALIVREMAKQCGVNWREDEVEFDTLSPAGLFGVGDLVSEDCLSVSYEQAVQEILDELLRTAGTHSRKRNWMNFCALSEIPAEHQECSTSGSIFEQLAHRPPIMSIFWLGSCLRGSNQVKLLQLADIAFAHDAKEVSNSADQDDAHNSDPMQRNVTVADLHAFVVEFVVNGRSNELRRVACQVVLKMACRLSHADKNILMSKLVDGLLRGVSGKFGRNCVDFIELLKQFVQSFGLDLSNVAPCVASALVTQLAATYACISKPKCSTRFDIANCVHCHCQNTSHKIISEVSLTEGSETWIDEQLRPCVKTRLETSTLASSHSEYASFFQLKFRVVLSEVHLSISDPRGRLVKNIGVYFSPRPVGDVSELKNDKYTHWQRCGTLSLTRHATTASLKLKVPVVAANLKLKYEDFYEKTGCSNRASDGSFVLHCPRCTRQVNNAHGVCGNCGEVAFQCRKCRHINYDRLDAFLCVECGYCTSGAFSYDVTVGMALNAVAIFDEDGYSRSVSMLRIANKRHSELRNNLKKKAVAFFQQQSKSNGQDERIEEMVLYGPHLKRAFLGRLPKTTTNEEIESKMSSSLLVGGSLRQEGSRSSVSSRARSLLSLARQLRSDSALLSGDNEGLSRNELLQQALLSTGNSGISSDVLDELNDAAFGGLHGSAEISLTRAIAGLQDRSQQRSSREAATSASGNDATRREDKKSSSTGECSRIYGQMREAERECYELTRRIEAWNRLNEDELARTGPRFPYKTAFTFQPTSCSECSSHVALSLTSLLSDIFEASISESQYTVTPELIRLLIKEPSGISDELKNAKRRSLVTLARTSEHASTLILEEIKLRLSAVQDVTSAELLGQLVEYDFPSVGKYIDFAVSVLQGQNH